CVMAYYNIWTGPFDYW
nr:immunoglobulin heavy chain junction region [Macaca mulatta]MOV87410.1 immunoglobulin heavy chain junction region [Macaca mulatta]